MLRAKVGDGCREEVAIIIITLGDKGQEAYYSPAQEVVHLWKNYFRYPKKRLRC